MATDSELSNHSVSRSMRLLQACAVVATVAAGSGVAHAHNTYGGTVEEAYKCEPEIGAANAAPDPWKWLDDAVKSGKVFSPACKAVFDRRFQACLKDPSMADQLKDPEANQGIPNRVCHIEAWSGIWEQVTNDREKKKQAEEDAKAKAAEDAKWAAKVAAQELPKATQHNAKLEKAVAAAYHREYPDAKVLKVILGDWSDDYEKDAFGRITGRDLDASVVNKQADGKCYIHHQYWVQHGNGRSWYGPLSGSEGDSAGSAANPEILCSKVEGAAHAPAKKPAKAAAKK